MALLDLSKMCIFRQQLPSSIKKRDSGLDAVARDMISACSVANRKDRARRGDFYQPGEPSNELLIFTLGHVSGLQ